jgi:hypothetical protein
LQHDLDFTKKERDRLEQTIEQINSNLLDRVFKLEDKLLADSEAAKMAHSLMEELAVKKNNRPIKPFA